MRVCVYTHTYAHIHIQTHVDMHSNTCMQAGTYRRKHRPQVKCKYVIHSFKVLKEDRSCNVTKGIVESLCDSLQMH